MGGRVQFSVVPEAARNVRHLGSLIFDREQDLGSGAYIDLTGEEEHQQLARDCIAAMYEHARPDTIGSELSVHAYATAIRELLSYCRAQKVPSDFRMRDLSFEFLLDYRAHLGVSHSAAKSVVKRRRFGNLLRLLQAGKALQLVGAEFQAPRNFRYVDDSDRTLPYPPGELLVLEDACRTHIRELVARLEYGKELLASGQDPRGPLPRNEKGQFPSMSPESRRWTQLPNLLWYVVHVLDGRSIRKADGGHSSFANSIGGSWGGTFRKADVYSHLYPLTEDLIPFVILLVKTTGRNESSILGLRRDCLQEVDGRVFLAFEKDRGAARIYRKPIPDDGPFSPVQLIRLLLKLTEPLVRFAAAEDRNLVLLGLTMRTHNTEPVKRLHPSTFKVQMNHQRERGESWCSRWGLTTEYGEPFAISTRRLRVNYLSARYLRTGQLSRVSRDAAHTLARTTIPYVENPSTRPFHEESIERAIKSARAVASPTIVASEHAVEVLGADEQMAARIRTGEQDVFFAACRDFYNRPGGAPNTPCDRPWGCFFCSNAVITSHVLPRVVKFRDFMKSQRQLVPRADWIEKFGKVWQVVEGEVLPSFTSEAIAHAEALATHEVLYVPLHFKG